MAEKTNSNMLFANFNQDFSYVSFCPLWRLTVLLHCALSNVDSSLFLLDAFPLERGRDTV